MDAFPDPQVAPWFRDRTFGRSPLSPSELARLKRERRQTISVCLPALDEAATIGSICHCIRTDLMERAAVVDELVVVDSGSTDATIAVAQEAGARVHRARDILPVLDDGSAPGGKGEALWKSLHVTAGDIVVWLDSDVTNFDASFVIDLVDPLVTRPGLSLAKGYYDRPVATPEGTLSGGGARVTEIAVRPLIALFYPALGGFVQPLAGEYAGLRGVLEDLRFFTDYGVDIALLIDVVEAVGLDGVAQVDLGIRVHRNRDVLELGQMSFQVVRAMLTRFDELGLVNLAHDLPQSITQFWPTPAGTTASLVRLEARQRPPLRTVARA